MSLAFAILAVLGDRACSGYDLAKQFDGSVGCFWKATHQQIYRELAKLETQGWIHPEAIVQTGRPAKKLYQMTDLGRQQLIDWLTEPCEPSPIKEDLLVKVFAGHLSAPDAIAVELQRHRSLHQQKLEQYYAIEQQYFAHPQSLPLEAQYRYLTLRRGIGYEQEWLRWCDEAIQLLADPGLN